MQAQCDDLRMSIAQGGGTVPVEASTGTNKPECPPQRHLLHEIFEAQAEENPRATAVVFGSESRTYADLAAQANRIARHLRRRGIKRGSLVAMMLPRCAEAYVGLLGILKA